MMMTKNTQMMINTIVKITNNLNNIIKVIIAIIYIHQIRIRYNLNQSLKIKRKIFIQYKNKV